MNISDQDKDMYLGCALKAADWFVNSQLGASVYKDSWNGDRGRFVYQYYMPERKYVPGINWTTGRAMFVLAEALKLTGKEQYKEAIYRAYRYIAALQVMDPYYKKALGAIKETVPQGSFCGSLDGAQAASALFMYEAATGDEDGLRRGKAFCDFILRHFNTTDGCPACIDLYKDEAIIKDVGYGLNAIGQCTSIPCWFMYKRTGEEKYMEPVIWGADFILECQRADGAFHNVKDITAAGPAKPNHHEGRGEGDERYVLHNDDGMIVVVLAAYLYSKDRKYIDAAVRYADWIIKQPIEERPYVAFPVRANTVLDIGKVAGKDYSEWVLDNLQKNLLDYQVVDSGDTVADGGFLGEDEQDEGGVFGGKSLDYVTARMTCYSAGTLFRLSGAGTGAGFSPFGLDY
jgi:hypothetical protein